MKKYSLHILGWAGALLVLYGYYLNANREGECWLIWIAGNTLMGVYCISKKAWPTVVMSFILVALNIYGYILWSAAKI